MLRKEMVEIVRSCSLKPLFCLRIESLNDKGRGDNRAPFFDFNFSIKQEFCPFVSHRLLPLTIIYELLVTSGHKGVDENGD